MIDVVGFDSSNGMGMIDPSWETSSPAESLANPPPNAETGSSLRSTNRKLRGSLMDFSNIRRERDLKRVQNPITPTPAFNTAAPSKSNADDISADLQGYFFDKMEKKGIHDAKHVYDQYLKAGFSPKAAIALTDRNFFPKAHEKNHGTYLKNLIGDELFKKEQAARKGKDDWIAKTNSAAIQVFEACADTSRTSSNNLKKHEYKEAGSIGGYLLGIAEIVAGSAIIATGTTLEFLTIGGFTIGFGVTLGTGAALIGTGLATTAANAKDISIPKLFKYDPFLGILDKSKEKPRKWDDLGSPPIRGDQIVGDGTVSPWPGFDEWKGKGDPSSGRGSWRNPETGQSLHPDLNHPPPDKPHWDYEGHPDFPEGAKLYPDGTWVPK